MERKFLEKLELDKEVIDKIMAEHGKTVETQKTKFEGIIAGKDAEITKAGETIKSFEGIDIEKIQGKITTYESEIATMKQTHAKELETINFNHALENALIAAGARNTTAVKALIKTDGLKLDGDKIIGFDDVLKPIMEQNPFLFETEQNKKPGGFSIVQPDGQGNTKSNPWAKDSFNLTKQGEIYEKNPDLARSLAAQAGIKLDF